jgi:hypothetical protein
MSDNANCPLPKKRAPWTKGKLIGARPPLRPKHVWSTEPNYCWRGEYLTLPF